MTKWGERCQKCDSLLSLDGLCWHCWTTRPSEPTPPSESEEQAIGDAWLAESDTVDEAMLAPIRAPYTPIVGGKLPVTE